MPSGDILFKYIQVCNVYWGFHIAKFIVKYIVPKRRKSSTNFMMFSLKTATCILRYEVFRVRPDSLR